MNSAEKVQKWNYEAVGIKFLRIFGILLILIGIILSYKIYDEGYEKILLAISKWINLDYSKINKLRAFFTLKIYYLITFIPLAISFAGGIIIFHSINIFKFLVEIKRQIKLFTKFFVELREGHILIISLIIIIITVLHLYFAKTLVIEYDEAFTFYNFTNRGLLSSVSYYPAPNNHILSSILTNIATNLPFSQTLNLRIPAVVVFVFSCFIFLYITGRLINITTAIKILPLYCCSIPVMYYGHLGRGYMLLLALFIIMFYSSLRLINDTSDRNSLRKHHYLFLISSSLGLYTIPIFLYPLASSCLFILGNYLLQRKYDIALEFIYVCIGILSLTCLLYLPVFLVSGLDAIFNENVRSDSDLAVIGGLFNYVMIISEFLTGNAYIIFIAVFLGSFSFITNSSNILILYCLNFILMTPVLVALHGTFAPPRVWIYLIIPIIFIFGLIFDQQDKRKPIWHNPFNLGILVLVVVFFYSSITYVYKADRENKIYVDVAKYLSSHEAQNVYVNHPLIDPILLYFFSENNETTKVTYSRDDIDLSTIDIVRKCCDFVITKEPISDMFSLRFIKHWTSQFYDVYLYSTITEHN